ncbi:Uncharacterised protein [Yersinia pseudotuberculosis]|uniref:hypothetical protein n=1 Tax=Yersinia pseudotuberculosis complex TaxID=1649845 RepID=UPI0005E77F8A|nr:MULTISPECIES: hypothetical protein [Yersinia pseudotuberculosis complex]MBO1548741.1 hypothetical protein [Yersinia pseudotuberculosis]MBO1554583.1 hypothetical protein [Yersinia pseudotuberculosis]MBO1568980.1 hypothetical protein [Yersinia pseudotuberculosis]MBO1583711.1 hypothetical protein [Yersinia pseudotuberculosis]MBO1633660.1 hypothetical protein [Yersinia pseudotuberculosis]
MKPSILKPGQRVLIKPAYGCNTIRQGTFIRRVSRQPNRPAHSVIRIDDFRGLFGPQDLGDTVFSDYEAARRLQPIWS